MIRRFAFVIVALALVAWIWTRLPNTLFYRERRPTRFGRFTNRAMSWYAAHGGLPSYQVTLETTGRRTGRTVPNVLVVARHEGHDYLVSMLGDRSSWVHNVRASGGEAAIRHIRRRRVRLEEVPVEERAPVLKAYLRRAFGARPHFNVSPDASIEEFAGIAEQYPVFRIVEVNDAGQDAHVMSSGVTTG